MPVPLLDPPACAEKIVAEMTEKKVALVFGREISGLSNAELHLCHYHVNIPVNPEYTSLNLAAAVMVLAYEIRKSALKVLEQPLVKPLEWDKEPATMAELDLYLNHLESVLIKLEFHKPENPRQLMRRLRRLYQRIQPDKMEINILRGILTATEEGITKSNT
jgi:tRNA (cytidine32/uridine32-2'-O)-methyltransferase